MKQDKARVTGARGARRGHPAVRKASGARVRREGAGADEVRAAVAAAVLAIHRRNGGHLASLDFDLRLLAAELRMDSLDLAEVMVELERSFGVSPFEVGSPATWAEVVQAVVAGLKEYPARERPE